ncbi:insulinase family protein [Patescibacteria group bacterium]|nr:insulinase family protein [Patescibacteria group bacterium]
MMFSLIIGSRFDPVGKEGLAHFFEHMLVAGTKNFSTKDLLAGYLEDLGGSVGASTDVDILKIRLSLGDPKDIESGVYLLSEILFNSLFDDNTIENERKAILRELESSNANPAKTIYEVKRRLFYQDTEVGRSTLGTVESINNINKSDLLDYFNNKITASLSDITISGDLDINEIKPLFEKYLSLEEGIKPLFEDKLPIIRNKLTDFEYFDNESMETLLGFRTENILHEDTKALDVLTSILTGGRTGLLIKKLRYEKGLVYSVRSRNESSFNFGSTYISCPISKDKIQEVLDTICLELRRISEKGPTLEELQLVKNRILKSINIRMQTSEAWVWFHYYENLFFPEEIWTIEDYLSSIEKTSAEDIKRVAEKYFTNDNWYLAFAGPVDESFIDNIKVSL